MSSRAGLHFIIISDAPGTPSDCLNSNPQPPGSRDQAAGDAIHQIPSPKPKRTDVMAACGCHMHTGLECVHLHP